MPISLLRFVSHACINASLALACLATLGSAAAADPDPKTYWDVRDLRPGMKGVGKTVMVGTELVEFQVEVLGVMRGVNPGRDMILCRLSGCNLEHAGIIQGMSGSPIYIDGKLVGAVAYAWEFAKDPIAGVTPFSQMVQYVQANDRRLAAEARDGVRTVKLDASILDRDAPLAPPFEKGASIETAQMTSGGGLAGMRPIATPLSARGFSPRALALLEEHLGPLGMTAAAGGGVLDEIMEREGNKKLEPGSPVSVAMVTGDFDLSGIGTVTHVEGDRVYAFGHPMMGLGACEFPMMTGYIHTVYPRASVSMKMGSPLKVVGTLDTDVSTAVSGRVGPKPDMMPMTVRIEPGRYAEPHTYNVRIVREPNLMASFVMTVLTSAIDTEGDLPDDLTARLSATIHLAGHDPIVIREALSGPRLTGPSGPSTLFGSVAGTVNALMRNPIARVRIESIDCTVSLEARRTVADIESVRLASDRVEPGATLEVLATLRPYKGEREIVRIELALPNDLTEGNYEATLCDVSRSMQRRYRNRPSLLEPRTVDELVTLLRDRALPSRTAIYLHVPLQSRGLAVGGQALPDLPASIRSTLGSGRETASPQVRDDLIAQADTPWVIEGSHVLNFQVVRNRGTSTVADAVK